MLTRLDESILTHLESDGRMSFADLGEKIGLSKSPCWKRVQSLEAQGIIQGYRAMIDAKALGLETEAFVQVRVQFEHHAAFESKVKEHPHILSCHATVGATDYILSVLCRSMSDLDQFLRHDLRNFPGVERFTTTLAMRAIKDHGRLSAMLKKSP